MATRDQVLGMFGASPEAIMARIRRERAQEVLKTQDPFQRAGGAIGLGLARMFGGEPEEVTRQRRLQETLQGVDMTNPEQMIQAAGLLNQAGFQNEALQLLSRADEFRTSAQQRATSQAQAELAGQQIEASKASVRRGQFDFTQEKEAVPVTIDGETYYVSVDARVKYDKDTGDRTVVTKPEQLTNLAQQQVKKMKREDLAAQSAETLRQTQLTVAQKQLKVAEKNLTQAEKDANITTGLVKVPVEEEIKDLAGRVTGYRTGFEYKVAKGRTVIGEDGKEVFEPFLSDSMPVAEVVDDEGIPQNAVKVEEGKQVTIKARGQEFVVVGSGEEAQYFQVITEGDTKYYLPTPVNPGTIYQAQQADQKPSPSVEPRPTAPGNTKAKADWDRQYGRTHYPDGTIKPNQEGFEDAAG